MLPIQTPPGLAVTKLSAETIEICAEHLQAGWSVMYFPSTSREGVTMLLLCPGSAAGTWH